MNMVTNTRVFFLVKTPQVTVPDNIEAGLAGREGDLVCVQTPARPQQKQNSRVLVLTSMHVIKILESMVVWLVLFIGGNN